MVELGTLPSREQRRTLAVAAAGTALVLIAFTTPLATLVGTARELDAGPAAQAWILSSMGVGLGVALLSSGAIADDRGRRRVFVGGAVVLALGSVLAALAPTAPVLIAGRLVQGIGGAALTACSLGLIAHTFPAAPARARASGVWGAAVGAGIAAGPLLAAGLEQAVSWRAAYWLAAAMALGVAVAARVLVRESRAERPRPVDVVGVVLLGAGLAAVLAGLVEGREGWTRPTVLTLLLGGAALLGAFALVEHRSRGPMVDLTLFRRPDFVAVTVTAFTVGLGIIALMSFLPTVLQRGLGHSALTAAWLTLAWAGTSVVAALGARYLPPVLGEQTLLVGGLLGLAASQLALLGLAPDSSPARLLPGLFAAGVASGVLNAVLGRGAVTSVPAGRGAMGSGANNTARYVGSAVGVTVVVVVAVRPGLGPGAAGLLAGWNHAVAVTAALSVLGALAVLAAYTRRSA